ncbi:DUF3078 domain-containing protein [Rhodohalobacter sulfatireducens]|uniref:DUF3078 domain-containing protein n=1 Tax=Rhodohalobacter sulfatireducens TaxID=2911366 RepID=A0ABS9K9N2_9BACT|nr:DUF3078 domain-containing protein [Rhodohalobacter sulfatireducens]MCG2587567.1 DUF3078 domain-containing protein [Rhodohalobacter sulfatireducens]MDR9409577.1 DUF3078 domain-containing protein [Balneolaceae bacterium]
MKHTFLLFSFIILYVPFASAQDSISIPDTLQGSNTSWTVGLNGSQASYSNWAQGGTNNIAATGTSTITTLYKKQKFAYGLLLDTRYGKTRIENEGTRKISDRLYFLNRFLYTLNEENPELKLFTNLVFRTQFDKGYDYGAAEDGGNILISKFMAPAYFNENIGLAYVPSDIFSVEAGIGLKQTYVSDESLSETYGLDEGDQFRSEAGLTIGASLETDLMENVQFSSSIQTFTNFTTGVNSTDVLFSNKLIGRINSYINTNLSLDLVYDDDFSKEIQVAQILSLGISYSIR